MIYIRAENLQIKVKLRILVNRARWCNIFSTSSQYCKLYITWNWFSLCWN